MGDVSPLERASQEGLASGPKARIVPETRYARSADVSIAYQVMGDGPRDLVFVPGIISHVEFFHELPGYTEFLEHLSAFARVIVFDKRGNGLSDYPNRFCSETAL